MLNSLKILIVLSLTMVGCGKSTDLNQSLENKIQSADIVYGKDGRVEPFEMKGTIWEEVSKSVATRVNLKNLPNIPDSTVYKIKPRTLLGARSLCEDEKFSKQNLLGTCTGFLVGKDILVTAGHCMTKEADCTEQAWVFDYQLNSPYDETYKSVPKKNVYRCKRIIGHIYDQGSLGSKLDYAVIQLAKTPHNRAPLKFRKEGSIELNTPVVVIGYPSGLPLKITDGGMVRINSEENYFTGDLDTFGGNSGSPVFNKNTGIVEGILVRGQLDYTYDREGNCTRVNVVNKICEGEGCKLEDVTRITQVKGI